jgi:hypothetical protein
VISKMRLFVKRRAGDLGISLTRQNAHSVSLLQAWGTCLGSVARRHMRIVTEAEELDSPATLIRRRRMFLQAILICRLERWASEARPRSSVAHWIKFLFQVHFKPSPCPRGSCSKRGALRLPTSQTCKLMWLESPPPNRSLMYHSS